VHVNGSSYTGNWLDDKSNGYGVFKKEGYEYAGQWVNDAQQGTGIETWFDNGCKFEGTFVDNQKEG
jgi:hypothetical protein